MRFLKEYIVLIIIFILLITFDVLSRNYTEKSIQFLNSEVDEIIKISLYEENFDNNKILKKIEEFEKDWKKRQEIMSFYAEHNELEKVNVAISLMKSKIESSKFTICITLCDYIILLLMCKGFLNKNLLKYTLFCYIID